MKKNLINPKKFKQRVNEMLSKPINEISIAHIDAAIKKAKSYPSPDLDLIDRLEQYKETSLNKIREEDTKSEFVHLGTIPVTISKAGRANSSRSVNITYDFDLYRYLPYESIILCCVPPRQNSRCAAVLITPDGRIENIRDEKTQNDFLKEVGIKSIYNKSFKWMIDIIQPESRDKDNKPVRPNRKKAVDFVNKIYELTTVTNDNGDIVQDGIKVPFRYFYGTRQQTPVRDIRVDDYVYIGGFNITDNVKVRVCKHIGVAQPDYRIYPVYIKYFDYAFIIRFRYALRSIDAFGGAGYGTAYTMLVNKGYLEKPPVDPSISASTIQSSIVNIYKFMKDLQKIEYDLMDSETPVNLCDLILEKISEIIETKDQINWNTVVTTGEKLNLDIIRKANNRILSDLAKKRKEDKDVTVSDIENEQFTQETDIDYGME